MSFLPSEIQHAIDANDYAKAAELFDDEELKNPPSFAQPSWPHALHMLCHMSLGQLESARHVHERSLAAGVSPSTEQNRAWELLRHLSRAEFPEVWAVGSPTTHWPQELQLAVQAVVSFFRQVATGAAQRVYCDIAVDKLGRYLGLDREGVLEEARRRGWRVNLDADWVYFEGGAAFQTRTQAPQNLQSLVEYAVATGV